MPEKYLIPSSLCAVHEINSGKIAVDGAPHPAGKLISHGPESTTGEGMAEVEAEAEAEKLNVVSETICFLIGIFPENHKYGSCRWKLKKYFCCMAVIFINRSFNYLPCFWDP